MSSPCQTYVGVVDDDEGTCRALSRLLRAEGIQPVTYLSAEAFLADTKRPQFGCLVFDIQLGGMSGVELHRQLQACGSSTPVIYIAAHDEPETRELALGRRLRSVFSQDRPGSGRAPGYPSRGEPGGGKRS